MEEPTNSDIHLILESINDLIKSVNRLDRIEKKLEKITNGPLV